GQRRPGRRKRSRILIELHLLRWESLRTKSGPDRRASREPCGRRVSRAKGQAMAKNTICLWYDNDAEAAARFYAETFPDSAVSAVHHAPGDYPSGKKGDVLTVEFT